MRILRYLTRDILLHTVAVSFVLFLVVFAGRFIRYLAGGSRVINRRCPTSHHVVQAPGVL